MKEHNENSFGIYKRSLIIYFFLISIIVSVSYLAIRNSWNYGLTSILSVLFFVSFFIFLERIIPNKESWHPTWKEWGRDGIYFIIVFFAGAIGQAIVVATAIYFAAPIGDISFWLEIPAALLVGTFGGYWFHRLGHVNKFFWQIHGIHHRPKKVNLANNSVVNFMDIIGGAICTQLPLLILDFSQESMLIVSIFTAMQGYFIHANADIRLGKLSYFLATPEAHRLHHSVKLEEAGNYGADIMLWDYLFGTFTWEDNKIPARVGVVAPDTFPETEAHISNTFHPFIYTLKLIKKKV